jgi:hypothetical protein
VTEQLPGRDDARQLSEPERRFSHRWQALVDQAGGRKVAARRIAGWTRATVYRDYDPGKPPPTAERLRQLCGFLGLADAERDELLTMLEGARAARQARRHGIDGSQIPGGIRPGTGADATESGTGPGDPPAQGPRPVSARPRQRRQDHGPARFAAGAMAVAAVAAVLLWWQPWQAPSRSADTPVKSGDPVAEGSYPGLSLKAIAIPVSSLAPALAESLRRGGAARGATVDGYVFRNMKNPGLCLTTADAGPAAGRDRGRVDVEACDYAPDQVWLPVQWEAGGTRFTQLVSFRYQSKCLNAQYISGHLADGNRTQLWNCYKSPNEYWDFGAWYQHVKDRRSYPVFVESAQFCLDADKYGFGNGGTGAQVNIWSQYRTGKNQFWS